MEVGYDASVYIGGAQTREAQGSVARTTSQASGLRSTSRSNGGAAPVIPQSWQVQQSGGASGTSTAVVGGAGAAAGAGVAVGEGPAHAARPIVTRMRMRRCMGPRILLSDGLGDT